MERPKPHQRVIIEAQYVRVPALRMCVLLHGHLSRTMPVVPREQVTAGRIRVRHILSWSDSAVFIAH